MKSEVKNGDVLFSSGLAVNSWSCFMRKMAAWLCTSNGWRHGASNCRNTPLSQTVIPWNGVAEGIQENLEQRLRRNARSTMY